jgi:hypothetical protein
MTFQKGNKFGYLSKGHKPGCSIFKKGHNVPDEWKKKISDFRKTFTGWNHSEKIKTKMSITAKKIGYHNSKEGVKKSLDAMHKVIRENHPKGMLGKHQTEKNKQKVSETFKAMWADPDSKFNSTEFRQNMSNQTLLRHKKGIYNIKNTYSNCKRGYYNINGVEYYFRSKWEANYALYLDYLIKKKQIKKWEYEVKTFWFEKIKRGVRSYTPDFEITNLDNTIEYHEVKGWMDKRSTTKLKRIKKYYPQTKMVLIDEPQYKAIMKWEKLFL